MCFLLHWEDMIHTVHHKVVLRMWTYSKLELPYSALPPQWNYGCDTCWWKKWREGFPYVFKIFLQLFFCSHISQYPAVLQQEHFAFHGKLLCLGQKYAFLNKQIMLYSMKAKKIKQAQHAYTLPAITKHTSMPRLWLDNISSARPCKSRCQFSLSWALFLLFLDFCPWTFAPSPVKLNPNFATGRVKL